VGREVLAGEVPPAHFHFGLHTGDVFEGHGRRLLLVVALVDAQELGDVLERLDRGAVVAVAGGFEVLFVKANDDPVGVEFEALYPRTLGDIDGAQNFYIVQQTAGRLRGRLAVCDAVTGADVGVGRREIDEKFSGKKQLPLGRVVVRCAVTAHLSSSSTGPLLCRSRLSR